MKIQVYNWPAANLQAIMVPNNNTIAGVQQFFPTVMNNYTFPAPSPFVSPNTTTPFTMINQGGSRTVSITSLNGTDLSIYDFRIYGTFRNILSTAGGDGIGFYWADLVGPIANQTAVSPKAFDTVLGIIVLAMNPPGPFVDLNLQNISIGTGDAGITPWYPPSVYRNINNFGIQVVTSAAPSTISYYVLATLDDVNFTNYPQTGSIWTFPETPPNPAHSPLVSSIFNINDSAVTNDVCFTGMDQSAQATTSRYAATGNPFNYVAIVTTGPGGGAINTGSFTATFLEYGIKTGG